MTITRYLEGVSIDALARGNRVLLSPLRNRHATAKADHAETLATWHERRAKAREIKDPQQRAKALEDLKGERPTHPVLVAAGCVVVGTVVLFGIPAVHRHAVALIAGGVTLWMIVAMIAGQKDHPAKTTTKPADAAEGEADGDDQDGKEPDPTVPTAAETHALAACLTAPGTSVLLTRLASDLAALYPGWEPSTKAVRALLAEAAVPTRPGVRTPDGNGPGVHHQDVPPLPSPTDTAPVPPVVANVGPAQAANANANNTAESNIREGFVLQADPANPAHTIVVPRDHVA
ncbi:hypothetical protein [Streptacidiphilus albus]|uniref:hypothetical protein n=1 Tax=Streptacidiphilus albus TaxID=105425 RepID=UPI000689A5C1|nr:hypothetical protein [Streptacidiphilus albus]